MGPRPATWRRVVGWTAVSTVVLLAALLAALARDPSPGFEKARDRIATLAVVEARATEASRVERLELRDPRGEPVGEVLVRRPADLTGVRRTLVVYAGRETGEQILALIPERPDLILVAPLYPPIGAETWWEKLAWPRRVRGAVFSSVAGGMATLDHLERTGIRRGRTVALGASLGTSFGTLHAALDGRVDELVVVHGGGDFPKIFRHIYRQRAGPVAAALLPWLGNAVVGVFDPVRWIGDVAPRPVLLIASRWDRHFPVESIEALYAAAGSPKRIVWTETEHVGAAKTEIVAAILAEIEAYLEETED